MYTASDRNIERDCKFMTNNLHNSVICVNTQLSIVKIISYSLSPAIFPQKKTGDFLCGTTIKKPDYHTSLAMTLPCRISLLQSNRRTRAKVASSLRKSFHDTVKVLPIPQIIFHGFVKVLLSAQRSFHRAVKVTFSPQ
jgi:hypothetical protein